MSHPARTAWAMVFDGPGRPLRRQEFALPVPAGGEILVRVRLATLCGSDLHTYLGRRSTPCPTVLGHEILGEVVAVGPGVTAAVAPGDRVTWPLAVSCGTCFPCQHDLPQKCDHLRKYGHEALAPGLELTGGLATHVLLLPGTAVRRVPAGLPDAVAAPANCATATVAAALRLCRPLRDTTLLIHGAGMLGLTACALATERGARCLAVDPDAARREQALRFGAVQVVAPGDEACVRHATAGRGADVALELSGAGEAMAAGLAHLRLGGTAVWVGAAKPVPPLALDPEQVVRRCQTIRGLHNYAPADLDTALSFLAAHHRRYPFAELVAQRFDLADAHAAFAVAAQARPVRVAVAPPPDPDL